MRAHLLPMTVFATSVLRRAVRRGPAAQSKEQQWAAARHMQRATCSCHLGAKMMISQGMVMRTLVRAKGWVRMDSDTCTPICDQPRLRRRAALCRLRTHVREGCIEQAPRCDAPPVLDAGPETGPAPAGPQLRACARQRCPACPAALACPPSRASAAAAAADAAASCVSAAQALERCPGTGAGSASGGTWQAPACWRCTYMAKPGSAIVSMHRRRRALALRLHYSKGPHKWGVSQAQAQLRRISRA